VSVQRSHFMVSHAFLFDRFPPVKELGEVRRPLWAR
jgi:hypothetical protein